MTISPSPEPRDAVLAIDFGGTKIDIGLVDAAGRILERQRLPTRAERGARQAVQRTLAVAARMFSEATEFDGPQVHGVGAVSPGVVLADRVLLAPNVPGWQDLALPALISRALPGLPLVTDNDVRAAALAELRWGQLRGIHTGLYVNLGTGLAAAMVIGGQLAAGANRAAGEIGYARVGGTTAMLLEDVIGGKSLGQRASEVIGRPLSMADAFADPDGRVKPVIDDAIRQFGQQLANFATLLDPERVVIGGGLMNAAERILPSLRRQLGRIVPFPPDLLPGAFVGDAALRGAAALAADAASGIHVLATEGAPNGHTGGHKASPLPRNASPPAPGSQPARSGE